MKKSIFIGGFDKIDILIYMAFIIQECDKNNRKKALVVDFTSVQKSRYIIPAIDLKEQRPARYITTYQKVDVAVGYNTYQDLIDDGVIREGLGVDPNVPETDQDYKYVFFDVDNPESLQSIPIAQHDLVFLATNFDIYSLEKGIEALAGYQASNPIHKMLFNRNLKKEHISYLEYITGNLPIQYSTFTANFPYDNGDLTVIEENQRAGRLNVRMFSPKFKSSLQTMVEAIGGDDAYRIGKFMKMLERN